MIAWNNKKIIDTLEMYQASPSLIRLKRIYNFLLFHAIILSIWMSMGFILHFYIIFGTNILTGGPA